MNENLLPKSWKNDALRAIEEQELEAAEFQWRKESLPRQQMGSDAGTVSLLLHKTTGYTFLFDLRGSRHLWARYSPGLHQLNCSGICSSIAEMMGLFMHDWLPGLKAEIEAPDLWADLRAARPLSNLPDGVNPDELFSEREQERLLPAIEQIKDLILELHDVNGEQTAMIESRFATLKADLPRSSRQGWLAMVMGTLFGVLMTLQSDRAQEVVDKAGRIINAVLESISTLQLP